MNCDELVELVTAFLDGALDEADARRFLDHVQECSGCGAFVEQFRQTVRALGGLPSRSLSESVRDALIAAFRERGQRCEP